jgi:hypothetical protein
VGLESDRLVVFDWVASDSSHRKVFKEGKSMDKVENLRGLKHDAVYAEGFEQGRESVEWEKGHR